MSALPPNWTPERPSPLPPAPASAPRFRRPSPPTSTHTHLPTTPSPLSPFSTTPPHAPHSIFHIAPAPKTPRAPLTSYPLSHYYRAPRSALSSPCRSNYSSPSVSPTRSSRRSRIQALLATDPLLSRLTPAAIREMANDYSLGFTPEERAWSLRAAEGIVKVGEWLREVEGWGIAWGRGKSGEGYLPPEPEMRTKKIRKKRPITPSQEGPHEVLTNRAGKPMTPMQLKLARRAAAAAAAQGRACPPCQRPSWLVRST